MEVHRNQQTAPIVASIAILLNEKIETLNYRLNQPIGKRLTSKRGISNLCLEHNVLPAAKGEKGSSSPVSYDHQAYFFDFIE